MSDLEELIAPYRVPADGVADRMGLAVVIDDVDSIKLIAAWTFITLPTWKRPKKPAPDDARRRWLWVWSGYVGGPDEPKFLEDLARRAGIPAQTAFNRWPGIVTTMLVFPDGTISDDARDLVERYIDSKERA